MSIEQPPSYYFPNINFNSSFYETDSIGLTQTQANTLYLRKTTPDTASAIETFAGGVLTDTINSITAGSNMAIASNHTAEDLFIGQNITSGDIYIGVNASATTGRSGTIHIGDGNNIAGGTVHINNGTNNDSNTGINNGTTTTGTVNIMSGNTSTGIINLATGSGSAKVNIGSGTTTGAIAIGNTSNTSSIFGTVKLPNLTTNNYTFRNNNVNQVITSGVPTRVRFFTVQAGSASMLGLTYFDGTFTNSNASGSLLCHISYSIAYTTNSGGIRFAGINNSYGLPTSGTNQIDANATSDMFLTGSTILSIPSAATFDIGTFQNSGVNLSLIAPNTNIQVLVL